MTLWGSQQWWNSVLWRGQHQLISRVRSIFSLLWPSFFLSSLVLSFLMRDSLADGPRWVTDICRLSFPFLDFLVLPFLLAHIQSDPGIVLLGKGGFILDLADWFLHDKVIVESTWLIGSVRWRWGDSGNRSRPDSSLLWILPFCQVPRCSLSNGFLLASWFLFGYRSSLQNCSIFLCHWLALWAKLLKNAFDKWALASCPQSCL